MRGVYERVCVGVCVGVCVCVRERVRVRECVWERVCERVDELPPPACTFAADCVCFSLRLACGLPLRFAAANLVAAACSRGLGTAASLECARRL
jgi:hypothetical protein